MEINCHHLFTHSYLLEHNVEVCNQQLLVPPFKNPGQKFPNSKTLTFLWQKLAKFFKVKKAPKSLVNQHNSPFFNGPIATRKISRNRFDRGSRKPVFYTIIAYSRGLKRSRSCTAPSACSEQTCSFH